MIDTGLANRVAVVTGANNPHGIGAGIARALAAEGAWVFLHGYREGWKGGRQVEEAGREENDGGSEPGEVFYNRQGRKPLDEVLLSIREAGGQAEGTEGDLAEPGLIPYLFQQAEEAFGPVEILVNNAAAWEADTFVPADQKLPNEAVELWTDRPQLVSAASFDHIFAVNARAVALMMTEFARRHVERGGRWGRIVNISTAGAYVFPSEVSYGASKLALEGYTRSAAIELGQFGITVNALAPGPVQTGWITPELEAQIVTSIPMGRVGTPEDIARVVVFLASEQAGWVSGQRLYVGGGHGM
jgi:3-oxoacyl-[acyl-carrier protein] reductase